MPQEQVSLFAVRPKPLSGNPVSLPLYPFQSEAIVRIWDHLHRFRSTLLVLPTGCGKTITFSAFAKEWHERKRQRVLIVSHRTELVEQAAKKIEATTNLECGIEQQQRTVLGTRIPDVVSASVQTLTKKRLAEFSPTTFGLIVTDEAHHAISPSYKAIYAHFQHARHLGVTATPDRLDNKALAAVYDSVAFVYDIRDAIESGFLVRIFQKKVHVPGLKFADLKTTKSGDFTDEDLEQILMEKEILDKMAYPTFVNAGSRPTVVFCTTVKHAQLMADVINQYAQDQHGRKLAAPIWGDMSQQLRRATLRNFEEGRIQFLVNCAILTEGVDIPKISCVSMCRPTKSRALYSQMVGRGTRLFPGKEDLLVLDFAGHSGQHTLVTTVDILDGNMDATVKERAQEKAAKRPNLDILEALKLAQEEIAEEEKTRILGAKTVFRLEDIDPFLAIGIHPCAGRWGGEPPTPEQIRILENNRLPTKHIDKGQAEQIINEINRRLRYEMPSPRQARQLLKFSIEPDIPKIIAHKIMEILGKNGAQWRPTPETLTYCRTLAQEHRILKPTGVQQQ